MSAVREFESLPRHGFRITCAGCGTCRTVNGQSMGNKLAAQMLAKKFRVEGWIVGTRAEDDRCPDCVRKDERKRALANIRVVPTAETAPAADPPREMSRDEKRLIFGKLNEVFLDETRGYDAGWSDKRVAEDLGVPRAWVAAVRDENFGPDNSSDEAHQVVAEAKAGVEKMADAAAGLRKDADALVAKARGIADQMQAEANAILKRVERIERAF